MKLRVCSASDAASLMKFTPELTADELPEVSAIWGPGPYKFYPELLYGVAVCP